MKTTAKTPNRRIVLIGNCQISALYNFYMRFASRHFSEDLTYVISYETLTEAARDAISNADLLVEQVQDFRPKGDIAGIKTNADRVLVPVVNAGFIWPFAGQAHPKNPIRSYNGGGPYGAETSDGYLNRMINKGVSPDDAVEQYAKLDINPIVNLDRLKEISLEKQLARDELTGFSIADLIARHFQHEQIFLTPYHPNLRIALALATQFFVKMGVDEADLQRMVAATRITPFPKEELPIHPSVARHFGMSFATPDRRYRFQNEGTFTFRQFVRRYVAAEWNEPLAEALSLLRAGEDEAAHAKLKEALILSPESGQGYGALSTVLDRLGKLPDAIEANAKAIELEPAHAPHYAMRGALLRKNSDLVGAEAVLREACRIDIYDSHNPGLLASVLRQRGELAAALDIAQQGLAAEPFAQNLLMELGHVHEHKLDWAAAEATFRRLLAFAPNHAAAWNSLLIALEKQGKAAEAITAIQSIIAGSSTADIALYSRLAQLLSNAGRTKEALAAWKDVVAVAPEDLPARVAVLQHLVRENSFAEAQEAARAALEIFPKSAALRFEYSHALFRDGLLEQGIEQARVAVGLAPGNARMVAHLGSLLIRNRDLQDAEEALRAATRLDPRFAHAWGELGHVLSEMKDHKGAVVARQTAVELDCTNPFRHAQLGHVLGHAGNYKDAEASVRFAIRLVPESAALQMDLSYILTNANKLEDAVAAVTQAVALDPKELRYHLHLVNLLGRTGQNAKALEAAESALAVDRSSARAHIALSQQLARAERMGEAYRLARAAVRLDPADAHAAAHFRSLSPHFTAEDDDEFAELELAERTGQAA